MSARKALGKGISALIPGPPTEGGDRILYLSLDEILPSPFQPRRAPDPAALSELARSIKGKGVIQPLLVRRTSAGFELIAGERRWRAAREAGLAEVPVVVREATDSDSLLLALVENLAREDLNPLEEAQGYVRLSEEFNLSQEEIAQNVGKDRATVSNALRLLKLPEEVRREIQRGILSAGHGRALLALEGATLQRETARAVISRGLSVRATEALVQRLKAGRKKSSRAFSPLAAQILKVTEDLKKKLKLRVEIRSKGKKGRLIIYYSSESELARLVDQILS